MVNTSQNLANISLGIVCPMANEKETAEQFISEALSYCRSFHFKRIQFYIILDNVSIDGTRDLLSKINSPELKIIFSPQNKNVVDAYKRGYQEAIQDKMDWILEIDAGFSHQPSEIPHFFQIMRDGEYDCVFGSRFCDGGKIKNGSFKKILISYGGSFLASVLLGTRLKDMTSGFELFKRETLVKILAKGIHSKGPFFQTEIRTFAHEFKITEIPITYDASTQHTHTGSIMDALKYLKRLVCMRMNGQLRKI